MVEILVFQVLAYLLIGFFHWVLWQIGGGDDRRFVVILLWPIIWIAILSEHWSWLDRKLRKVFPKKKR